MKTTDPDRRYALDDKKRLCVVDKRSCDLRPLGNFGATIVEEIVHEQGELVIDRIFVIEGWAENGDKFPPVKVPVKAFAGLKWIMESWGIRAVRYAGIGKDKLREAIQLLSEPTVTKVQAPAGAAARPQRTPEAEVQAQAKRERILKSFQF